MIQAVEDSYEEGKHLMVEAGTGTGKSLGYLIPSLYYGLKHDRKVLVSTHTINLQEQLRERDVPLLHDIFFPVPFKAAVIKGRSHYLCLRKFENKINLQDLEYGKEDRITAGQMLVWLSETKRGDEEELHFNNKGASFWHTVASDSESCLNRSCPWFKKVLLPPRQERREYGGYRHHQPFHAVYGHKGGKPPAAPLSASGDR